MGFFKKLKERLFGENSKEHEEKNEININKNIEENDLTKEKKEKGSGVFSKIFSKKSNDNSDDSIDKKEAKLQKINELNRKKQLVKEKKINKYIAGLDKSGSALATKVKELQNRYNKIDEDFFDELEEILILSDISINLVFVIMDEIKKMVKTENVTDPKLIGEIIADKLFVIYTNNSIVNTTLDVKKDRLNVILMVGVNGSGKTTTIAKLSNFLKQKDFKILIAAADTFRAGAVQQLEIWAKRLNIDIVKPEKEGQDPSSVVYKALEKAQNENYDLLIIDTAGRLQNKINLMNELAKLNKTIEKFVPDAPHESLLVLDATNGQNALNQAASFKEVTPISGMILTKMDGTSKGGIVISIKDKMDVDVKFIGLGEKIDDLQEFDLDAFIYGLTKDMVLENYAVE